MSIRYFDVPEDICLFKIDHKSYFIGWCTLPMGSWTIEQYDNWERTTVLTNLISLSEDLVPQRINLNLLKIDTTMEEAKSVYKGEWSGFSFRQLLLALFEAKDKRQAFYDYIKTCIHATEQ